MSVVTYYHVRFGVIDDEGNISVLYCQNKAEDILVSNSGNQTYVPDVATLEALINKFNKWTFRDTDIGYSDVSSFVYNGIDCNVGGKILDARALKTAVEQLSSSINDVSNRLTNHINNKNNPHGVTKAQVGLGNCDNTADVDKSVKYAENANGATRIHSLGNNHDFMLHWDDHDAWLYINSIDNYIKLGPVGNDLSKKQDVNQYKTVQVTGTLKGNTSISFQTDTWTETYNEPGWRMIALCGYYVSAGTVGKMFIDVSTQSISATVTWNPQIPDEQDITVHVLITCAPTT